MEEKKVELTEETIEKIAKTQEAAAHERIYALGKESEIEKFVAEILAEKGVEMGKFHHCKGMNDVRALDPDNKSRSISLLYPARCGAWALAAQECGEELKADEKESLDDCLRVAGVALYILENGDVAYLEPPIKHVIDENGALSCHDGPAIEFRDRSESYAVNDVFDVPKWVVMTPVEDLDPQKVLGLENADHRRIAIERMGIDKMVEGSNVVVEEDDKMGSSYVLRDMSHVFNDEKAMYLEMVCPSYDKKHVEGVPNDISSIQEALDFRSGVKDWNPSALDGFSREGGNADHVQQGDVGFEFVSGDLSEDVKEAANKVLLPENGVSGSHVIANGTLYANGEINEQYIVSKEDVIVKHTRGTDKHNDVTLRATTDGYWRVFPMREQDHVSGMLREVID